MSEVAHCHRCDILDLAPGTTECFGCEQPPLRDTTCETCAGIGYHERENWHENEVQDCPDCGGTGQREGSVMTITIPMAPRAELSPNRRGSEHWRYRHQAAKELREAAFLVGSGHRAVREHEGWWLPTGIVTVHEHIVWPKGRRLVDPDAIAGCCKAALDGIVDAGIIAGDSAKHVASVTASQEKGTDATGRIVITITAVTPDMTTPESTEPRAASGGV